MSILNDFKEYIQLYFGVPARYKAYTPGDSDEVDEYHEQNCIIIFPSYINLGNNNDERGIKSREMGGDLAIYLTEDKMKEEFIFDKYYQNADDRNLVLGNEFKITHYNASILEIAVSFVYYDIVEYNRDTSQLELKKIYINKKEVSIEDVKNKKV